MGDTHKETDVLPDSDQDGRDNGKPFKEAWDSTTLILRVVDTGLPLEVKGRTKRDEERLDCDCVGLA